MVNGWLQCDITSPQKLAIIIMTSVTFPEAHFRPSAFSFNLRSSDVQIYSGHPRIKLLMITGKPFFYSSDAFKQHIRFLASHS